MSENFETWMKDFMKTPEWENDSFHWDDMAKAAYNAGLKRAASRVLELALGNIPVQPSFTYSGISAAILDELAE